MTRQKVALGDCKGLKMVAMAMSKSSLFSDAILKPFSINGGRNYCSRYKAQAHINNNANNNINNNGNWVDSMRASSPPKSPSSLPLSSSHPWMASHPSALEVFDKIIKAAKGKQIVMFLDYDGTLSPIVQDPDRAYMSNQMRAAVKATAKHFPTAIVTGRCKDKVYDFVKLKELYYAGSHGMDIEGPTSNAKDKKSIVFQPPNEFMVMIDRVSKDLAHKIKAISGAKVENNKFCVSVHFRCVDDKKWGELAQLVKEVLDNYPKLKMTYGRKVMEIKPIIQWNKGKALEFLLEALGLAKSSNVFPIYIGDDTADEDAFNVLRKRKQGFGILVSKFPKQTSAAYTLQDPSQVMCFLQRLVEWKELSVVTPNLKCAKYKYTSYGL